uniref:Uncharacterized protein n=1 Tax=Rhizophora mucronata TaxID=61149 RepID=A0A2P2QGU3_RHIMU
MMWNSSSTLPSLILGKFYY